MLKQKFLYKILKAMVGFATSGICDQCLNHYVTATSRSQLTHIYELYSYIQLTQRLYTVIHGDE